MEISTAMKKLWTYGAAGLLVFVLAACGGSADEPNAAAAPTPTTAPAVEAAATEPPTAEAQAAAEEAPATAEAPAVVEEPATDAAESGEVAENPKTNLNDMTEDALLNTIPNFSEHMMREFFEYQPYVSIQQFRQEIGKYVDEMQVAEYEQYVYVPVDVDESDAETLKQLPGVTDDIAAELMAARPYGSNEAFLEKLAGYIAEADVALAATYLGTQ